MHDCDILPFIYFFIMSQLKYMNLVYISLPSYSKSLKQNKVRLIKLFHSVFISEAPAALSYLTNKPRTAYNFRRSNNASISYRGAILWNAVSTHFTGQFTDFYCKVKKDF